MITAQTPLTKPTERSISAIRRTKTTPIAIVAIPAVCRQQVHEVALGVEAVVEHREQDCERREPDEDRQRAEISGPQPPQPAAPGLAQGLGDAVRLRRDDLRRALGLGHRGLAHATTSAAIPGTCASCPAVIAWTTSCWFVLSFS